jgi:outer membrane receptor protein involved in Fe transport
MNANYSYVGSQTSGIKGRSDKTRRLEDAPKSSTSAHFQSRASRDANEYQLQRASIHYYQYTDGAPSGPEGPLGDNDNYPHIQVDAQGSYALPHGFKLLVSGLNLTNEEFGFYYGSPKNDTQCEFHAPHTPSVSAGRLSARGRKKTFRRS